MTVQFRETPKNGLELTVTVPLDRMQVLQYRGVFAGTSFRSQEKTRFIDQSASPMAKRKKTTIKHKPTSKKPKSPRPATKSASSNSQDPRPSADESCCPLVNDVRVRLASEAQTATIKGSFPKGMSQPSLRALFSAGLLTLEQLAKVRESEVAALHGMGPKGVTLLRAGLKEKGLSFLK